MAAVVHAPQESDSEAEQVLIDPGGFQPRLVKTSKGHSIIIFISRTSAAQSFWQAGPVALWLLRTKDPAKANDRRLKAMTAIQEFHHWLWPGEVIATAGTKRARKNLPIRNTDIGVYFATGTLSTSMVIAYMTFCCASPKRNPPDRAYACAVLAELLRKVADVGEEFSFWFQRHGDDTWQLVVTSFENGECVLDGSLLWTDAFYGTFIRFVWGPDYRNEKKPWVAQPSGKQRGLLLRSYLCFAMDAGHKPELRDDLSGCVYCVLTQLAAHVESCLTRLTSSVEDFPANWGQVTNVRKMSESVSWALKASVSKALLPRADVKDETDDAGGLAAGSAADEDQGGPAPKASKFMP